MSKKFKVITIILSSVILLLGLSYAGLAYYYSHSFSTIDGDSSSSGERCFSYGTYINGSYVTGMTPKQVNEDFLRIYACPQIAVFKIGANTYNINLEKIEFTYDFYDSIVECLNSQNPLLWIDNMFNEADSYEITPECTFDLDAFEKEFSALKLDKENKVAKEVYISYSSENGYELYDGKTDTLDIEKVKDIIIDELSQGNLSIEIPDNCVTSFDYTTKEKELLDYFTILDDKQSLELTYIFGNENKKISKADMVNLYSEEDIIKKITPSMVKNGEVDGINFEVEKEKVDDFIKEFLDEYNTYNNRHFITHDGTEVYVDKGNYGNKIDLKKESQWFIDCLEGKETSKRRTPSYLITAKYKEKNDFGNTYFEIDLDCQHMWYYVNGKPLVDTYVVTGSNNPSTYTSPRVVSVCAIIPNKWLNGPTWHCFVKYWVAIQGSIGIHDASWRDKWSDDQYLKGNGSHGCINTPEKEMEKIFKNVEMGTPAIVYSHKKNGVDNKKEDKK